MFWFLWFLRLEPSARTSHPVDLQMLVFRQLPHAVAWEPPWGFWAGRA